VNSWLKRHQTSVNAENVCTEATPKYETIVLTFLLISGYSGLT